MQHEAECKSISDGVPKPVKVPGRIRSRCGVGLDFNADYTAVTEFDEYVHFMSAVRVADMEQTGRELAYRALGPQLCHDEAVEQPAQQVTVTKDGPGVYAEQRASECGIDQVPLRQPDQAVQPIG